jgi:hypothetical protein
MMPGLRYLDPETRAAADVAVSTVSSANPAYSIHNASLRAAEDARFVFAVFYSVPDHPIMPSPYALVAVERQSQAAEMIDPPHDSPYWIRGRK